MLYLINNEDIMENQLHCHLPEAFQRFTLTADSTNSQNKANLHLFIHYLTCMEWVEKAKCN